MLRILMRSKPILRSIAGLAVTALMLVQFCVAQAPDNSPSKDEGRSIFNASCVSCHGLDGGGTDKGMNIAGSASIKSLTDAQLANIISEGVIEEGMPAFRNLKENQLRALVSYVRMLQGKGESRTLPGDPKRGQKIFFSKGDCGQCHTVAGRGGFLGPDLTNHAATSSADGIRDEIVRSPRVPAPRYRMAAITTTAGDRIEGVVRNEDNFSVQLQSLDGSFHLLRRAEIKAFDYTNRALMPTDYRSRLSDSELNDLVSYLLTTPDSNSAAIPRKKWDEDEE